MKTKWIIILVLFSLNTYGQLYTTFMDTNSVWRDSKAIDCFLGPNSNGYLWWDAEEFIKGDTIINTNYGKLYLSGFIRNFSNISGTVKNDSTLICNLYIGGLREDSLKHIYFIDTLGQEKLLFNFNLTVGDSILIPTLIPFYAKVQSIDSVYIFDKYRKRFNLNPPVGILWQGTLVEGVGMNYGLLGVPYHGPGLACGNDYSIAYFYKNTNSFSFTSAGNSSSLINCNSVGINELKTNSYMSIAPNPFNDFTLIKFNNGLCKGKIYIYNIYGQQLRTINNISQNIIRIERGNLPNGVYFLRLSQDNQVIATARLLIVE